MKSLLLIVIFTLSGNFYIDHQTNDPYSLSVNSITKSGINAFNVSSGDDEFVSFNTDIGWDSIYDSSTVPKSEQDFQNDYSKLKQQILLKRDSIHSCYLSVDSIKRDSIVKSVREYIFEKITNDIFNYWYGTPWNFYGLTSIPKEGSIACGYFVMRVLAAAGFNVPIKWGDLASEVFIKKLTDDIQRFYRRPIDEVTKYVEKRADGLYIVGLDCHVGFIYKNKTEIRFVHSNYYHPDIGVMAEEFETENPLNDSKYRVLGRILDDEMVVKWINKRKFK